MAKIIAAGFDIDGTLTQEQIYHPEVVPAMAKIKEAGIKRLTASGRPLYDPGGDEDHIKCYNIRINPNAPPVSGEAALHEDTLVTFFTDLNTTYSAGGLTKEQIIEIESYLKQQPGLLDGLRRIGWNIKSSWVCKDFPQKPTDQALLEEKYQLVKLLVETPFPYAHVIKSRDALDILQKGVDKSRAVLKYSEVAKIPLEQMAFFGDGGNDLGALLLLAQNSGLAVFVGDDPKLEERVKQEGKGRIYIPPKTDGKRGPPATIWAIYNYLLQ